MSESTLESSSAVLLDSTEKALMRVLHVDDDPSFLKAARQCLETQGSFQVDVAYCVEEALKKMKENTYNAVISDYMMPEKDGLEFLKELRENGNNVPFIIFTGKGREEVAIQALNFGADQYLNKNGNPATVYYELAHGIRRAVERKMAEDILQENKNYLQTILNSIFTGVVVIDAKTHEIVDANPKALETIGGSRKQVVGKVCNRFICPAEKGKCPITDLGQTVDKSERVLLKVNGERIPILKTVVPMIWKNHKYMVESFVDITEHKQSEKTLLKSEEKFKSLMEEAPIGICNTNLQGKITYVNKRFEEATGYSRDEIVGKDGFKLNIMSDETLKLVTNRMKKRLLGKPSRSIEGRFKRKDEEWIWAELEGRLIKRFGIPVGFQLITRDITERKKAEEERKSFEERLSALNIHSRELNMAKSREKIYRLTLEAMEKTLGFEIAFFMVVDKDELRIVDHRGYPESFSISLPLDGTKRGVSVKVARTGKSINVPDAEKEDAWVEFMPSIRSGLDVPVKIGNRVLGVIGVDSKKLSAFDEKDQQLLEILAFHAATAMSNLEYAENLKVHIREIQESHEKFKQLFLDNPEAAVYVDSDSHILDVNPRFSGLFGYSLDKIRGKRLSELIVPEDKKTEGEALDREAKRKYTCCETVRKTKDGTLVPVAISASPITVEGQPMGYVGTYKDITETKCYEMRLSALNNYGRELNTAKNLEKIYQLTLDAMEMTLGFENAAVMIVDKDMLCVANQRGFPEPHLSLRLPLDGSKGGISVEVVKTGKPTIVADIRKERAYVEVMSGICSELDVPIKIGNKAVGVLNVESRRKGAFNEKDRELLEILASHVATAIHNVEYAKNVEAYTREVQESQQKFERLFMKNPEPADYLDPDFRVVDINPRFSEFFGYSLNEAKGKHINELIVPEDKMEEANTLDKKAEEGIVSHDTVRKRKDGTLVSVSISAAPIIVENKLIGTVGLYKDITQLKKTETELKEALKKLQMMNEKLSVVGKFTRHDVRNKLATILMCTYLAQKRPSENEETKKHLSEIESACEKVKKIFDFAGAYEKLGMEELSSINVGKTIEEAIALFSDLKGVKIINKRNELAVLADSLLTQVFYNLIDNSLKYGENIDQIEIHCEKIGEDHLKIVYKDNGVGIPRNMKHMLFREGFSSGKGTGYGLYLIKKICEAYGWTIEETGEHHKGVEFTMTIPRIGENGKKNY